MIVAALAFVVLVAATILSLPRPPALDGRRWLMLWMATLLRGSTERAGGSQEDWAARVVRFVPWHPAARQPERKITHPEDPPPTPALDGEIALAEALSALPDPAARFARMYDTDPNALADRLSDPALAGEAYDPATWFGSGAGWDAVAAGPDGPLTAALREATTARWILVGEPFDPRLPDVDGALLRLLGPRGERFDPHATTPLPPQADSLRADIAARRPPDDVHPVLALLGRLGELAPDHGDHLVLVGVGSGIQLVLEALRASAVIRDQTLAVLAIGGVIRGLDGRDDALGWQACTDWLQANFRHQVLDLEAAHRTPYLSIAWLDRAMDPPGALGVPLDRARFPEPADQGKAARESIEVVDLGVVPVDPELPTDLLALALWGTVTGWIRARRP